MSIVYRAFLLILVVVIVLGGGIYLKTTRKTVYKTFDSPDNRYRLVLYEYDTLMSMPGQASDAPGLLCLYDRRSKKKMRSCKVDMVQLVNRVDWSGTNVSVPLVLNWNLP